MNSLAVETALALVFVFAAFGIVVSVFTEAIADYIGLRGEYLMRGVRSLVDSDHEFRLRWRDLFRSKPGQPDPGSKPVTARILEKSYVKSSGDKGDSPANAGNATLTNGQRRRLPSYLSSRTFARAAIDVVAPNSDGKTTIDDLIAGVENLPEGPLKSYVESVLKTTDDDIKNVREGLEQWYDDHMARVSGWYKRHVRWISLLIGAVLVLAFNVNSLALARSLYTDQALRDTVVTQAVSSANCGPDQEASAKCLDEVRGAIADFRNAGLPIGWPTSTDITCSSLPCPWLEAHGLANPTMDGIDDLWFFLVVLAGWIIMVLTLLPGSRFWFDLLGRLGSLRSTGPKPPSSVTT